MGDCFIRWVGGEEVTPVCDELDERGIEVAVGR